MTLFNKEFLQKLNALSIHAKKVIRGNRSGRHSTARKGASVEFVDHRVYSPGDDLRYLDWNVYGRLGSLFTKRYSSEESIHIKIFLDCSTSMDFGSHNKFFYAQRLAAAIAYIGIVNDERVEIIPFTAGKRQESLVFAGRKSVLPMLDFLQGVHCDGRTDFKKTFASPFPSERGKRIGFLISDFLDPEGYEYPMQRLLLQRFQMNAIHVIDDDETKPTQTGNLRLLDTETSEHVEVHVTDETLRKYTEAVRDYCNGIETFFKKKEASYVRCNTQTPVEEGILLSLRQSGVLSGSGA